MFSFFKKKKELAPEFNFSVDDFSFIRCDMHSHMLAGIDDGPAELNESVELIRGLYELGYRKMITTPHVHGDFYRNSKDRILNHFDLLQERLQKEGLTMEMEVSAEYYLDQYFLNDVVPKGLLTFGNNHLLVETSLAGWPRDFNDILFSTQSKGYQLILAHPERYLYEHNLDVFRQLKEKGIELQLNLLSLFGYYGRDIKEKAEQFLEAELYDYVGTDLHHERHLLNIKKYLDMQTPSLKKLFMYRYFKNNLL